LNERLKQKVDEAAEDRADLLVTQLTSFSADIEQHVQSARSTIARDIDQMVEGMNGKVQELQHHNENWVKKTAQASVMIEDARLDWIKNGVATILAPMLIGAICSAVAGLLIASIHFWSAPAPTTPPQPQTNLPVETVTGLGGLGKVARHPPGSEVVPCPLRSASGSVCVRLPRENQ
jgi:TolA-binding protein